MKKCLLAGAILAAANVCVANEIYVGVDYSMLDVELKGYDVTLDSEPAAINLKLGNTFNENFAIEAILGMGLIDDSVSGADFDFELDNLFGISAVGLIPLNETVKLYGKVGVAKIDYDDSDGDKSDASGLFYGVGISADFTRRFGMSLEYLQYPDGDYEDYKVDIETTSLSLGAHIRF